MMNEKERYETYRKMFDRAQELRFEISNKLTHKYSMVYTVFVAVGDEEQGLYFVDVEAGGSEKTYFHFQGRLTEEQILKKHW